MEVVEDARTAARDSIYDSLALDQINWCDKRHTLRVLVV
jgi:hypothetical protein